MSFLVGISILLLASVFGGGSEAHRYALRVWTQEAQRAEAAGQLVEAARAYGCLFALDTTNVAAAQRRGTLLARLKRPEDALTGIEILLRYSPGDPDLWQKKGWLLTNLISGEYSQREPSVVPPMPGAPPSNWTPPPVVYTPRADEAIAAYREVLRLDSSRKDIYRTLARACRAIHREKDALRVYEEAQRVMPDSQWVWSEYGLLLSRDPARRAESHAYQNKADALVIDAGGWKAWSARAEMAERGGRFTEAVAAWDSAIVLNKRAPGGGDGSTRTSMRSHRAELLFYKLERYAEADSLLRFIIRTDPRDNSYEWYLLAKVLWGRKRPLEEQLAAVDSALAENDGDGGSLYSDIWLLRSATLLELHRDAEAIAALDTVLLHEPHNTEARTLKAHLLRRQPPR